MTQVEQWLTVKRADEPTVKHSVNVWCHRDALLVKQARPKVRRKAYACDEHKVSMYFSAELYEEFRREANRQGRSLSWVARLAWTLAKAELCKMPEATK